jgi:hypothetical protein
MGERTLSRLLIIGSSAVVLQVKARRPKGFVARTDAGSQTAHAGDGRARQQDCILINPCSPPHFIVTMEERSTWVK